MNNQIRDFSAENFHNKNLKLNMTKKKNSFFLYETKYM